MPIYMYHSKTTDFSIEVIRSFDEFETPPTDEELPETQRGIQHEWERLLGVPLFTSKWPSSTGPVKGNA